MQRAETAHSVSGPLVAELVLAGLDCYTEPISLKVGSFDGRMISGFTVYLINLIPWDGFSLGRHKSTNSACFALLGKTSFKSARTLRTLSSPSPLYPLRTDVSFLTLLRSLAERLLIYV